MSTPVPPVIVAEGLFTIGNGQLALIAGPCVVEDLAFTRSVAEQAAEIAASLDMPYCFKASYDKANRSALESQRGPGREEGLAILAAVKESTGLPILTDVHETAQVRAVAEVVDYLQIPAFLCRQTDLLVAVGETGKPVNIKKGQFAAPEDMAGAAGKVTATGNSQVTLTERGTTFGYHNLVVDMRGLPIMRSLGHPVIFDATHSVQLPSGLGGCSGGQREFVPPLLRAAVATGLDGLFLEVHPDPDRAPCDGPNMLPLTELRRVLETALRIHEAVKESL
ncbi:MAG: 3-deoxy-8-phosphooctulonate synthase [candidate division WS1 bacterium]|nr:3-deoxy-8-phosphooctulonate synthase [candidate division WS1 bacterium]